MKRVRRSRTRGKTSKANRRRTRTGKTRKTTKDSSRGSVSVTSPIVATNLNVCEEVEVGDIGGFGSAQELEAHEERCTQNATEFCNTCAKKLCGSHYELLHRDHDAGRQIARTPTGQ